uniref:Uncharacterized protein n=1 Tax=Maize yellow striate virus TaxID=1168550 RepID=A0A2D1GTQ1_9RHAB|nr:hypothetical protein [Maize yellow striate virus]
MNRKDVELSASCVTGWIRQDKHVVVLDRCFVVSLCDPRFYNIDIDMSSEGISVTTYRNNKPMPPGVCHRVSLQGMDLIGNDTYFNIKCDVTDNILLCGKYPLSTYEGISIDTDARPHVSYAMV